jgi:hypothetical protein
MPMRAMMYAVRWLPIDLDLALSAIIVLWCDMVRIDAASMHQPYAQSLNSLFAMNHMVGLLPHCTFGALTYHRPKSVSSDAKDVRIFFTYCFHVLVYVPPDMPLWWGMWNEKIHEWAAVVLIALGMPGAFILCLVCHDWHPAQVVLSLRSLYTVLYILCTCKDHTTWVMVLGVLAVLLVAQLYVRCPDAIIIMSDKCLKNNNSASESFQPFRTRLKDLEKRFASIIIIFIFLVTLFCGIYFVIWTYYNVFTLDFLKAFVWTMPWSQALNIARTFYVGYQLCRSIYVKYRYTLTEPHVSS